MYIVPAHRKVHTARGDRIYSDLTISFQGKEFSTQQLVHVARMPPGVKRHKIVSHFVEEHVTATGKSRLKGGCSQDWLPHGAASRN